MSLKFDTDFDTFRADAVGFINRGLDQALASQATGLDEDRVLAAAKHAVSAGGKRLRGMLVLCSAAACHPTGSLGDALAVASSIELMHAYSLVHDDLPAMDDDDMRRGKPTAHVAFDEATAVLAGDALQTLAFGSLATGLQNTDPGDALALVAELAQNSGFLGMVGGQMLDILAESADPAFDLDTTKRLQAKKTGALLRYSCRAGAIMNGERGQALNHLDRYGSKIGLAFQIVDDLLDLHGDAATVGKAVGKDSDSNKATFIDLLGEQGARDEVARLTQAAVASTEFLRNSANCSSQNNAINQMVSLAQFIAERHH